MDLNRSFRARQSRPACTKHLLALGVLPPRGKPEGISGSAPTTICDELSEDDVFWIDDLILPNRCTTISRSIPYASTTPLIQRNMLFIKPSESIGVLEVLPEHRARSVFDHKLAKSGSATSSSWMIPKKSNELPAPAGRYNQSMPVNVPVLSAAMIERRQWEFDDIDDEEPDGDGTMVPPHEMVARSLAGTEMVAFSVLEGAGRTLKGRDLRQVRNAVFRQTGFLD